jgi:hypothetical protein
MELEWKKSTFRHRPILNDQISQQKLFAYLQYSFISSHFSINCVILTFIIIFNCNYYCQTEVRVFCHNIYIYIFVSALFVYH